MVQTDIKLLKANAFTLSGILKEYQVKLSSKQCLDILSRVVANVPFEALLQIQHTDKKAEDSTQVLPDLPIPAEGEPDIEGWFIFPSTSGSGWRITRGYSTSGFGGVIYDRNQYKETEELDLFRSPTKLEARPLYSKKEFAEKQKAHLDARDAMGIIHPETLAQALRTNDSLISSISAIQ